MELKVALNFTYSNFIYLDTNILSYIARNKNIWGSLQKFLFENDLCIAISDAHFAELHDAKKLHSKLSSLLLFLPSAIVKPREDIIEEEVKAHPYIRTDSIFLHPLIQLILEKDGFIEVISYFRSNKLGVGRKEQLEHAEKMPEVHKKVKPNFPPTKSGEYIKGQASDFANKITFQWLLANHIEFLEDFEYRFEKLNLKIFLSIRTFAYTIFYKYYLQNREPYKPSDFGDLFHVFYIPYCKLAIIEKDLCDVLNQIKNNSDILNNVKIENIDFFKKWK